MLENVPRQLSTKIRIGGEIIKIPEYIKKELEEEYLFNRKTLAKAKDFGVPQLRERNINLLVKKEVEFQMGISRSCSGCYFGRGNRRFTFT